MLSRYVDPLDCDYQKPRSTSGPADKSSHHSKAKNHERNNPNRICLVLLPGLNGLLQNINAAIIYGNYLFWCWWLMFPFWMFGSHIPEVHSNVQTHTHTHKVTRNTENLCYKNTETRVHTHTAGWPWTSRNYTTSLLFYSSTKSQTQQKLWQVFLQQDRLLQSGSTFFYNNRVQCCLCQT